MLGVCVGSAALIIILSAFNGIENLVISMSNTLNPDLVILPAQGKTFNPELAALKQIQNDNRLASYSEYLKEKALLRYGNQQYIGEVKGVKPNYSQNKALKNAIIQGDFILEEQGKDYVEFLKDLMSEYHKEQAAKAAAQAENNKPVESKGFFARFFS